MNDAFVKYCLVLFALYFVGHIVFAFLNGRF